MRLSKKAEEAAEAERRQKLRAERERAVFGDAPAHYQWLRDRGYLLRPRYAPDWVPSWRGTKKNRFLCEDGKVANYPSRVLDGTRVVDGTYVTFKLVKQSVHPHEVEIGQLFCSEPLIHDPKNHCVPILDVLQLPGNEDTVILVMSLLRDYNEPPFDTIGEAVECFRQLFEGLQFMHKNRVAHRDCMSLNTMMDATRLYIDDFHPVHPIMKRDFSGFARYKTRTQRPPKYFFIDFGLSRRYDPSVTHPLEVPIWGGDKEVPEFQNSNEPCDPFPTDVFYIGNAIRKDFVESKLGFEFMKPLISDMVQNDPSKRPTMDEVVQRFESIRAGLSRWKLRSRVVDKQESMLEGVVRGTAHWTRRIGFVARNVSAIPIPS
ncbi:hypothetical protein F5I97DRAFT_1935400 [Phlebopus sp. FC_14]|nr:hypothetical protein F5I97DRAFT_1935400 [Phlebopus sp. FC_14]